MEPQALHHAGARPPRNAPPPPPHPRRHAAPPLLSNRRAPDNALSPRHAQPGEEAGGGRDGGDVQCQEAAGRGSPRPPTTYRCQPLHSASCFHRRFSAVVCHHFSASQFGRRM